MNSGQSFDWAKAEDERHESDGFEPVAMPERTVNRNQIALNINVALRGRLGGGTGRRPHGA
jgi:hypothetical protein